MKCSVIRLSLFFLVIYFNYGFSLPRFNQQYPTRVLYKYNDGSTLSISDSYVEKPTLKEIIYYHIIERPYPERKEQEKTKAENPEESIDSVEAVAIDPRKDKPDRNIYSTEKPDHGKRQRREVSLERNTPERRSKRANYRSWVPFSPDLSRMHIQYLPEYVREILTDNKPVQIDQTERFATNGKEKNNLEKALLKTIEAEEAEDDKSSATDIGDGDLLLNKLRNPKYAYLVGHISSTLAEEDNEVNDDDEVNSESSNDKSDIFYDKPGYIKEPNVVEHLEYDEFDENNGSEDDASVFITKEKDFNEHKKPGASDIFIESTTSRNNKDSGEHSKLSGTSEDDWIDKNAADDNYSDEDSSSMEDEDIECDDCDESGEDTSLNFDDILNEIHQIFIEENSTIELEPGTFDNPDNLNILNLLHNVLKEHSKSTTQGFVIKVNPNQSNFLDVLRGLFTNIVKNNVIINNNVPVTPKPIDITAEKDRPDDREKPGENTEKPVSEQNLEDDITTTESPKEKVTPKNNSSDIDQSKDKDVTLSPLESTTATAIVKNPTEIHKNKSNDTDKLIEVNSTTPAMETESSSKGTEKPTTSAPIKIDSNITNEKVDGADVDKKIDYMLDLVNNENFWKFMGELGGKYLESLMTHTSSVIKEQISAQVKEHLEALNKLDEKLALEKEKGEVKENKPVKDKSGGKNTEPKNINETVSIKAHNLFGNTVGNDKVTNVYVFYANEHFDEIIKNIHEIANKTKPANGTNIFTFIPNQLELNNGTSKPTITIVSEVTTELPKTTVNHVADKPHDEHKPTEPTTNGFDITHPNNIDNYTQTVSNCDHDQSHCDKNEVSTKPSINIDQPHNITVHTVEVDTTENNLDSTTVGKEQTPEITTPVVDLIPEKVPVTETTDKPGPTTENISSEEPITENIAITTESIATKQNTTTPVTNIDVQTETTLHSTQHSETTTDANLTTEPFIPKGTTISDTTTGSTTERSESVQHHNNETSLDTNTSDVDKDKVTTESMKPVTDNSSSTTEITSAISDTITGSTTEKSEGISHQNNETSLNKTSEDDKAKVTTESMKPVADNISSTTEITSTISDKTTGSTTAKSEGVSHQNNDTSLNTNTNDDDKASVTTESMKPVTDNISSSTEFASSTETTTSHYNASSTDHTESDLNDISTTKSSTKIYEDTNHTSTEPSLNIDLNGDDNKKDNSNNTESVTDDIKLTTEAVSTETATSVDQADNKNHTVLNNENNNSTADHSEIISTTESLEHKTDSINITTEATTEKTTENTNSTNDESKIITEKSESNKADTEVKEAIESTTEKHEDACIS